MTMSLPPSAVIVSVPNPPMTVLSPAPTVSVSSPPSASPTDTATWIAASGNWEVTTNWLASDNVTNLLPEYSSGLTSSPVEITFLTGFAASDPQAPEDMKRQLREASEQARNAVRSLDETVWTVNPGKDSLAHLITYMSTYAEQFFLRTPIRCRQAICPNPPDHPPKSRGFRTN